MRMPEFTAELSLFKSERHYGGVIGGARVGTVMLQQNIVARPPIDIPPVSINCDLRHRGCEWGCNFGYRAWVRDGVPERTCAQLYFVCSDACDLAWESCRGLYRDPNYDPFADRFAGVG